MKLTSHFSLAEMTRSALAARRGISNVPDARTRHALGLVARHILEPVRTRFAVPFSPSSGYRSLALNRQLGSADRSQHVRGEAVDFELPGVSNRTLAQWIADNLLFDQLILECYRRGDPSSGWVHCSFAETCARGQVLTYSGGQYFKGLTH